MHCQGTSQSESMVHLLDWTWLKPISVWLLWWDLRATCVPSNVIISRNTWGCWWVMMGHLGRVRTRAIMTMTGHSHFYYRALWCGIRTHSNSNVFIKVFIWFVNVISANNTRQHLTSYLLSKSCIWARSELYQSGSCEPSTPPVSRLSQPWSDVRTDGAQTWWPEPSRHQQPPGSNYTASSPPWSASSISCPTLTTITLTTLSR